MCLSYISLIPRDRPPPPPIPTLLAGDWEQLRVPHWALHRPDVCTCTELKPGMACIQGHVIH